MKKIICTTALFICLLCLFSCGSKYDPDYVYDGHSLIGLWCEEEYDPAGYYTYEFTQDSTMVLKYYRYGILFDSSVGKLSVETNKFIVEYENYDGTKTYNENKFSITEDNELVVVYLDEQNEMEEEEMVLVPYCVDFVEDNSSVVGSWEDTQRPGEVWTFNKDYTGSIFGNGYTYKFYYSINDDSLFISNELIEGTLNDLIEYHFSVKDNRLSIDAKINGTSIGFTFERK